MKQIITQLINFYQKTISPDHSFLRIFWGKKRCRFYPSCSVYMEQAISQYGLLGGGVLSLKRIARCNPFSEGGYDPV